VDLDYLTNGKTPKDLDDVFNIIQDKASQTVKLEFVFPFDLSIELIKFAKSLLERK